MFDELLQRVGPRIEKQNTNCRTIVEPGLNLAVMLRFLATGASTLPSSTSIVCHIALSLCQRFAEQYKKGIGMKLSNARETPKRADCSRCL